jgi:hypothetical protein
VDSSTVFTLSKWKDWTQSLDSTTTLFDIRIDSQDSWIFRSPLNTCALQYTHFPMGSVGCDNRLADVFRTCGYSVSNPGLFLRANEISSTHRDTSIYGGGVNSGTEGTKGDGFVLLADSPPKDNYIS